MSVEWMSADTAPINSRILVYSKEVGIQIGIQVHGGVFYSDDKRQVSYIYPTEWQPLPPPPVKK